MSTFPPFFSVFFESLAPALAGGIVCVAEREGHGHLVTRTYRFVFLKPCPLPWREDVCVAEHVEKGPRDSYLPFLFRFRARLQLEGAVRPF